MRLSWFLSHNGFLYNNGFLSNSLLLSNKLFLSNTGFLSNHWFFSNSWFLSNKWFLSNNLFLSNNGLLSNNGCTSRERSALRAGAAFHILPQVGVMSHGTCSASSQRDPRIVICSSMVNWCHQKFGQHFKMGDTFVNQHWEIFDTCSGNCR